MKEMGLVFDLEDILLFCNSGQAAEDTLIFSFLKKRKYLFYQDDLQDKTPYEFMLSITDWQGNDAAILEGEIRKIRRNSVLNAKGAPSVSGVLQALSKKYRMIVLSKSQGDGLVHALANIGIRSYVDLIIPAEDWVGKKPDTLGLEIAMAKYPEVPLKNWHYIALPDAAFRGKEIGMKTLIYGRPPFGDLEDIMEEFL